MRAASRAAESLRRLISPRSIAIVGASNNPGRIGGRPLTRLLEAGYSGRLFPVNPAHAEIQGLPALRSVDELPLGVDAAIIAVKAEDAIATVRACARRDVGAVVLFSAGFSESGAEGARLQAQLTDIAKESSLRIFGPNCLGLFNASDRSYLTFSSWVPTEVSPKFRVGVVSQSGGYGSHILRLCQRRGVSISHWFTTGNECDVEAGELIHALATETDVAAIFVYLEGARSRETLLQALAAANERRIPVVVVKSGSTDGGAAAAASHTAALAGADAVYNAVFREYGVFRALSTEEAIDVLYALSVGSAPSSLRTAVFTLSGGVGVQIADYMCEEDVLLPDLSEATQRKIKALAPQAATRNPLDITAQFVNDPGLVRASLDLILGVEGFNVVFSFLSVMGLQPDVIGPIVKTYGEMMERYPGRLNIVTMIATPEVVASFEQAGCMVFEEPKRAVRALSAIQHFSRVFGAGPMHRKPVLDSRKYPVISAGARFNEVAGKQLAATLGIDIPREIQIANAEAAQTSFEEIDFPVALKVVSADILHKTDLGGVRLNLQSDEEVARAIAQMHDALSVRAPNAVIDGYLISPMIRAGVDCIVGTISDPLFGPVVMFGIGGVLVEIVQDVSFRLAPVDEAEATRMITETQGARLLNGYRGNAPADIPALAKAIAEVSAFAAVNASTLKSFEINPLRVLDAGSGAVAIDAAVETFPLT